MGLEVIAYIVQRVLKNWPPENVVEIYVQEGGLIWIIDTSAPKNQIYYLDTRRKGRFVYNGSFT